MSDMLKVTQPLIGSDNIGKLRPQSPSHTPIQNIPDPTRVTKPNQQGVNTERQPGQGLPHLESNFDFFMQMLKGMPSLSETMPPLLMQQLVNIVSSGIEQDFAAEIGKFMKFLQMNEGQLLSFVQNQAATNVKFTGPIFDALRTILGKNPSEGLTKTIAEFVRTFDNTTASGHLMKDIMSNLKNISSRMPASQRAMLTEMMSKLILSDEGGSQTAQGFTGSSIENLNTLKTEIFPFLARYMSYTRDFGPIRDIVADLTLNLVKYENGTADKLVAAFEKLMNYPQVKGLLQQFSPDQLRQMLFAPPRQEQTNVIESFLKIISSGIKGEGESREVFESVLKSILINQSVYMPLQHLIIPANINGKMFFSEIWADPDADNSAEQGDPQPANKLLIKFDIEGIGFFEIVLLYKQGRASMLLFYPPSLESKADGIKKDIAGILNSNGIVPESLSMEKSTVPLPISDVFPQIYEKKDTVNVKV